MSVLVSVADSLAPKPLLHTQLGLEARAGIEPPPAAAVSPTVSPVMRVDCINLALYDNYQIQRKEDLGGNWGDWNGGLFSPTDMTNSQYLFITNGAGFFRVRYAP